MSMLNRPVNGNDLGEVIASTRDYETAQKTVSKLIAGEVPARDIAIVGEGVRTVERVTGKLGYAAAARSGATNGVLIGLVLSAIMLFGNPEAPITLFLGFILVGVALGMIMSLITYAIVRRRRDFASVSQMLADHYEVRVQAASLAKARSVVGADRPTTTRPAVDLSEPPRYGERITPGQSAAGAADGSGARGGASAGAAHVGAPHTAAAPPPPPPVVPAAAAVPAAPAVPPADVIPDADSAPAADAAQAADSAPAAESTAAPVAPEADETGFTEGAGAPADGDSSGDGDRSDGADSSDAPEPSGGAPTAAEGQEPPAPSR